MNDRPLHTRWLMELPLNIEGDVTDWLLVRGASATYREADPPMRFYAYFPPGSAPPDMAGLAVFEGVSVISEERFADEDWLAKSREGFGSIEAGRRFYIRPLWDAGPAPSGRMPIIVNPGLAFGTGGHETTRLCMELLEDLAERGRLAGPVLDIGSGTGILALAAHLLGATDITALDNDPDCGPAMLEFIQMNSATARHPEPFLPLISTLEDPSLDRKFNLMFANILLETILELLPAMLQRLAPVGYLIASGILAEKLDEALLSISSVGLRPKKVATEGEWVAILFQSGVV